MKQIDVSVLKEAEPNLQPTCNQLATDCISRQAAIDAVLDRMNVEKYGRDAKPEEIQWALEKLPSAQPEQRWIPCSERLPEEDYCTGRGIQHSASVLVTIINHANDDDVFVDMACTVDGKWQLTYPIDDDPDTPKWCEIVAWMPLPEPYVEKTNG